MKKTFFLGALCAIAALLSACSPVHPSDAPDAGGETSLVEMKSMT